MREAKETFNFYDVWITERRGKVPSVDCGDPETYGYLGRVGDLGTGESFELEFVDREEVLASEFSLVLKVLEDRGE